MSKISPIPPKEQKSSLPAASHYSRLYHFFFLVAVLFTIAAVFTLLTSPTGWLKRENITPDTFPLFFLALHTLYASSFFCLIAFSHYVGTHFRRATHSFFYFLWALFSI